MAEVAAERRDPFRVLIACLLSLRTKDETTGPAAARLFALADTPEAMRRLPAKRIERAIFPVGFYPASVTVLNYSSDGLPSLVQDPMGHQVTIGYNAQSPGSANLVVTQGFNKPGICVDIHVHRISNRLGYVKTKNPTETETALRKRLPRRYWIGYNDLLVSFGQNICHPVSPRCSECPVRPRCARVGVTRWR